MIMLSKCQTPTPTVFLICSSQGYVNRQALYACSTCTTTESAGVCLACSLTCHDGHDLYELYTKRYEINMAYIYAAKTFTLISITLFLCLPVIRLF